MTSVGDDCYYFYYSSCMKAAACAFRHSAPALGKEEVCPDWMKGSCRVLNCPLRHMIIQKDRGAIPCFFETQPGGCQKAHCTFKHTRPRPPAGTQPQKNSAIVQGSADNRPTAAVKPAPAPARAQPVPSAVATKSVATKNDQTVAQDAPARRVPVATPATSATVSSALRSSPAKAKPSNVSIRITIPVDEGQPKEDAGHVVRPNVKAIGPHIVQPRPKPVLRSSEQKVSMRQFVKPADLSQKVPNGSSLSSAVRVTARASRQGDPAGKSVPSASPSSRQVTHKSPPVVSRRPQSRVQSPPSIDRQQRPADNGSRSTVSQVVSKAGSTVTIKQRRASSEGHTTSVKKFSSQPVGVQSLRHLLDAKKQAKKVGSDSGVPSKSSSSQGLSLKDIRARRFAQRAEAKSTPASNTPVAVAARPVDLKPSPSPSAGSGEIRVKTLDEIRAEKRKHRMTASSEEMVVADRKAAPDASPPPAKVPCRVRRSSSQQQQPTAQPEELTHKAKASSSRKPELPVAPANPPKIKSPTLSSTPKKSADPTFSIDDHDSSRPASRLSRDDSLGLDDDIDLLDDAAFQKAMNDIGYDGSVTDDLVDTGVTDDDLLLEAEALM